MTKLPWKPLSREELERITEMAVDYKDPPSPRAGYETIALYDKLHDAVMLNLGPLLALARRGL